MFFDFTYQMFIDQWRWVDKLSGIDHRKFCQKCEDREYLWGDGLCFHCALEVPKPSNRRVDI